MEAYLKKFLEELPKQTIFDQIQVVLDHNEPTEQELEWVKEFQDKYPGRLKHIVVDKVDPIGVSMNRCIKEADADIVAIWNVDDLRTPDSLEKQVNLFENYEPEFNEMLGVVHGNFIIVNKFGNTHGKLIDHYKYTYETPEELTRSMVLGPFFAFKKSLCEQCGYFDEQLKSGADYDLAIRLALFSHVEMVPGILGYYLDEGKGASTRGDGRQPIERTVVELRYGILDKIEERYIPEAMKYDIRHVFIAGKKIPVNQLVRDYNGLQERNDFRK